MGNLENIAQRLILSLMKDTPETLDPLQQRSVALWLAIKSMVWEQQDKITRKCVPQSDRDFMYANREPPLWRLPDDWFVWLGRTDAPFGVSGAFHLTTLVVGPNGSVWSKPTEGLTGNVHAFAMFSGAFVGVVLRAPFPGDGELFQENGSNVLRPIWPLTKSCVWPPGLTFPAEEVWALPQILVDAMTEALG